jgi:hypothetical protein
MWQLRQRGVGSLSLVALRIMAAFRRLHCWHLGGSELGDKNGLSPFLKAFSWVWVVAIAAGLSMTDSWEVCSGLVSSRLAQRALDVVYFHAHRLGGAVSTVVTVSVCIDH